MPQGLARSSRRAVFLETTQLSESWVQQMKPEVQTCDIFAIDIASRGIHWVYLPEEAEP